MLEAAAETPADVAAIRSVGGRPSLDPSGQAGKSPLWTVRVPQNLDRAVRELAGSTGQTFSEVIRAAATEYLNSHRAF